MMTGICEENEKNEENKKENKKLRPMKEVRAELKKITEQWSTIDRMTKDLCESSKLIEASHARYLVDYYYQIQKFRIRASAQARSADEPNNLVLWVFATMEKVEKDIQLALGEFAKGYKVGQWMQSICGIGPVISAGMMAHLDVRGCETAGHFWNFAGLNPKATWNKKEKRPWNAGLKTLCYKVGECFVKVQNNDKDFYGKLFRVRKDLEIQRNSNGEFKEQAANALESKNYNKTTDAYKAYIKGELPPLHLHARARRYTVKIFLSHLHHVMYEDYFGKTPPVPFVFEHCGGDHRHFISPPNYPFTSTSNTKSLKDLLGDIEPINEVG